MSDRRGRQREVSAGSGEVRYHSSREERTAGREPAKPRGGFLKHNRSLAIVLIDVVFVFIVFLLFRFLGAGDPTSVTVSGVDFTLDAFEFDSEVYMTVTARSTEERTLAGDSARVFTVTFPDGSDVTDVLPTALGSSVELRAVIARDDIPSAEQLSSVTVRLEVADEQFDLVAGVGR